LISNNKVLPKNFSDELIDPNIKSLPEKYCGNNIFSLALEIDKRENLTKMLVKDEFETTPQFLERVKKFETEKKKQLLGIFNYESTFAIETNNTKFKYDADKESMSFEIHNYYIWLTSCKSISDKKQYLSDLLSIDGDIRKDLFDLDNERSNLLTFYTNEYSGVRSLNQKIDDLDQVRLDIKIQINRLRELGNVTSSRNLAFLPITVSDPEPFSFSSSFKLGISRAEKIKPNLRTLLIASLAGKEGSYFDKNSISKTLKLTLLEIWIYNNQTGEIYIKFKPQKKKSNLTIEESKSNTSKLTPSELKDLLNQAQISYKNGNDEEARALVRRILANEPMNAESYLLLGKIHLRRGDLDQSISSFKTALFWDNKLIDAHLGLAKIYLQRGDCLQAKNYVMSGLAVDNENPDAHELQRQVERCSG
jgi:tetratricopeptide (TPR) repeat protein